MGLQKCGLNLNRAQKELQPHGTFEFPCVAYDEHYSDKPGNVIPWHWHNDIEIAYVKAGCLQLCIPGKVALLEAGDCAVINANVSHCAVGVPQCELYSIVFSPALITGNDDSAFALKYISPLVSGNLFDWYMLDKTKHHNFIAEFIGAFEALAYDLPGFEFIVRNKLSDLCFFLYQQHEHKIGCGEKAVDINNLRIKDMLDFIHNNYANEITVSDIAKVVDISERECLRCFQKTVQLSPIQYLLKYRVMQGAALLSEKPAYSISQIATFCGFSSASNFSKLFKRFYNTTPRECRKQNAQQDHSLNQ